MTYIPTTGKEVGLLRVRFNNRLQHPRELSAFRGAIVKLVGRELDHYHNHDNREATPEDQEMTSAAEEKRKKVFHRYPLIQYSIEPLPDGGLRPVMIALADGNGQLRKLLLGEAWDIKVNGRPMTVDPAEITLHKHHFGLVDGWRSYRLTTWLGFNKENHQKFGQLRSLGARVGFIEHTITSHLMAVASGIGWQVEDRIRVELTDFWREYRRPYKGVQMAAFDLAFRTNVALPLGIGLGKGTAVGYGRLGRG